MATPFDATGQDLVELDPAAWLAFLGRPRPAELVRLIDADLSATVSTATDKIVRVDDPEPWLVLIELQANWDGDLPFNLLRRYALVRHRHRLPTSCVVILLRPSANTSAMTGAFEQPDPLGTDWPFPFHVVRMWERPVDDFLTGPLALVPFAPIAKVDEADAPRVKSIIADRLTNEAGRSDRERLVTGLLVLAALRLDEAGVAFWSDLMSMVDISKTALGEKLGREARVEELRDVLLDLGTEQFGPAPAAAVSAIHAIADRQRLRGLIKRVSHVSTWDELLTDGP